MKTNSFRIYEFFKMVNAGFEREMFQERRVLVIISDKLSQYFIVTGWQWAFLHPLKQFIHKSGN